MKVLPVSSVAKLVVEAVVEELVLKLEVITDKGLLEEPGWTSEKLANDAVAEGLLVLILKELLKDTALKGLDLTSEKRTKDAVLKRLLVLMTEELIV